MYLVFWGNKILPFDLTQGKRYSQNDIEKKEGLNSPSFLFFPIPVKTGIHKGFYWIPSRGTG